MVTQNSIGYCIECGEKRKIGTDRVCTRCKSEKARPESWYKREITKEEKRIVGNQRNKGGNETILKEAKKRARRLRKFHDTVCCRKCGKKSKTIYSAGGLCRPCRRAYDKSLGMG